MRALTRQTHIPVDAVELLDLAGVVLLVVVIQVLLPLRSRDALSRERAHIVACKWQENVQPTERALQMLHQSTFSYKREPTRNSTNQQEVRALLVRNPAIRLIGVLALIERNDELLVLWLVRVQFQRFCQAFATCNVAQVTSKRTADSAHDNAL